MFWQSPPLMLGSTWNNHRIIIGKRRRGSAPNVQEVQKMGGIWLQLTFSIRSNPAKLRD